MRNTIGLCFAMSIATLITGCDEIIDMFDDESADVELTEAEKCAVNWMNSTGESVAFLNSRYSDSENNIEVIRAALMSLAAVQQDIDVSRCPTDISMVRRDFIFKVEEAMELVSEIGRNPFLVSEEHTNNVMDAFQRSMNFLVATAAKYAIEYKRHVGSWVDEDGATDPTLRLERSALTESR